MVNTHSTNTNYVAGIDIGGTNIEIGILNAEGEIANKQSLPTNRFSNVHEFVKATHEILPNLVPGGLSNLSGIGVGAPNGNFYTGCIQDAPNLEWDGVIPLSNLLQDAFHVPTLVTNDANAAAFGEAYFGAAQEMKTFIMVTIGTGLGSGIVIKGDLLYGSSGFAGELGHSNLFPGGRDCSCGRKGCLETYVSARGLVWNAIDLMVESQHPSILRPIPVDELTPKLICNAALQGDPIALQTFRITGEYLGQALADTVALLSPECIFLFGGLMQAGDLLRQPIVDSLESTLLPIFKGSVKVKTSTLNQSNAAVLGAGALAWSEIRKRTIV